MIPLGLGTTYGHRDDAPAIHYVPALTPYYLSAIVHRLVPAPAVLYTGPYHIYQPAASAGPIVSLS